MVNNLTVVNIDDTREVVIEPDKPSQPRLKQYIVQTNFSDKKQDFKTGTMVRFTEADAAPFVASRFIVPLDVAMREGSYPVAPETKLEKVVQAVTGEDIPDTPAEVKASATDGKKSFLGNALRDAIQKKKSQETPGLTPTKIDQNKLAAIQSGGAKK